MKMHLEPLERAKTYERVVRQIKAEIFAGRLRPGDRLPGERQLSELLQVSRPSVREAVRILQALEIVRSRPGAGASSGLIVSTQPSRALSDLLGLHVALSSYSIAEVMSVRMALETQSIGQLADRVKDADLSEIASTLEDMSVAGLSRTAFHELDTKFHLELARCSNNTLLADLMSALRDSVGRTMEKAFAKDPLWAERQEALVREHAEILAAVQAGDAALSTSLMRAHIEGFYESLNLTEAMS